MAKAFEPKKFVAANAYQDLVERNAKAIVEETRRTLEQEAQWTKEKAARAVEVLSSLYQATFRIGLELMPYVPKSRRHGAIEEVDAPDEVKEPYHADLQRIASLN